MGKLGRLGLEPARRYERARSGELIHIDVKKLGRISGGATSASPASAALHRLLRRPVGQAPPKGRLGLRPRGHRRRHAPRLRRGPGRRARCDRDRLPAPGRAFFERHGMRVERVLTDNGSPYVSTIHAIACLALGIRHLRTRPRRPQTNGKAERLIRTMIGGWAYGAIYGSSAERTAALDGWLWRYIGRELPIRRLNNLLGYYV